MAKLKQNSFSGEILHVNATRIRVTGSGNLQLFIQSLDNVVTAQLTSIPMASVNNIEPTVLANFISQRSQLKGQTVNIDETFMISRIIMFVKPIYYSYPQ